MTDFLAPEPDERAPMTMRELMTELRQLGVPITQHSVDKVVEYIKSQGAEDLATIRPSVIAQYLDQSTDVEVEQTENLSESTGSNQANQVVEGIKVEISYYLGDGNSW